ncbi:hypothetical protein L2E82_18465 [Cichorium intybus]|uniref:Uncharacterized protein n=1 Tax=Cichorium intybus TaxID=13427 RepID=A0ACB9FA90_CICIN|nr:hypothetical protein L2E82_18465 [Cichorium intybus]
MVGGNKSWWRGSARLMMPGGGWKDRVRPSPTIYLGELSNKAILMRYSILFRDYREIHSPSSSLAGSTPISLIPPSSHSPPFYHRS